MDQRRLLLAVILSMGVILAYYTWMGKHVDRTRPRNANSQMIPSDPASHTSGPKSPSTFISAEGGGPLRWSMVDESANLIVRDTDHLELTFSARAGDLKSIGLRDYSDSKTEQTEKLALRVGKPVGIFTLLAPGQENEWTGFQTSMGDGWVQFDGQRGDIQVIKRYDFHRSSRFVQARFEFTNTGSTEAVLDYETTLATTYESESHYDDRYVQAAWLAGGKVRHKGLGDFKKGYTIDDEDVVWSGIRTKYFCLLLKPFTDVAIQKLWKVDPKTPVVSVRPKQALLSPGQHVAHKYLLYAGPQNTEILGKAGHELEKAVDSGFLGGISNLIMAVLRFFYSLFGNWGWAIILLAVVIKLAMHPLTEKSLRSMKELQALQPEMSKMKEKFKNSPEKLNKAMMEFYKEHKVNPLGGCLPILLQMPIFFALYNALIRAVELRGAQFMLWIKDLSQPDKFMALPVNLPLIGGHLHLLPILMGLATIVQQKLSTTPGAQSEQQMVMAILMPIFLTFIFYNLPSGLVLYWTTNTVLTIIHQQRISSSKPKPA